MTIQQIDLNKLKEATELLRAVVHPLRLRIINLIDYEEEANVNTIYTKLNLEQSITSQHLKVLRENKVVITTRRGKMIYYTLNYPALKCIFEGVSSFDLVTKDRQKKLRRTRESVSN